MAGHLRDRGVDRVVVEPIGNLFVIDEDGVATAGRNQFHLVIGEAS